MRYARKRDGNHRQICGVLQANGVTVVDCSQAGTLPDLLTWFKGKAGWLEVKMLAKANPRYTFDQLEWIATTPMPVRIVTDDKDALDFAKTHAGAITQAEKDNLAAFLYRNKGKRLFTVKQVAEALGHK